MSNDQSFKNRKPGMGKAEPGTIKRIFSYIFQYKWRVVAIVICILIGAAAQAGSALFLQSLIDTYILPMVGETNPDWAPLLRAISLMGCLYLAGIVGVLGLAVADRHRRTGHAQEDPRRHVRPPAEAADPLLRQPRARRHHEPLHQRHRYAASGDLAVVPADVLLDHLRAGGAAVHAVALDPVHRVRDRVHRAALLHRAQDREPFRPATSSSSRCGSAT